MNRRDILKAALATPLVALLGSKVEAEEHIGSLTEEELDVLTDQDSLDDIFQSRYWEGPHGEYMKIEQLAHTRDDFDFFFAVYPPDFTFSFYHRFTLPGILVDTDPKKAQELYWDEVVIGMKKYLKGIGSNADLGIEGAGRWGTTTGELA